ncbi:GNAT family N-acetyltransferase [Brevibacterium sp. 5221]|uniref:GNAT family N-acetyltransferase n=1 Tax=Brevibacterium rongguiense TaxID=2695267 RepID=A0A6N9H786_9MICO|nr:GNAT family N-acetyltransferase [Brevibacterium rongguiense]MYM19626.1 GNAT family N-acetyltransferase [Brevibacterium rongguiense]
MATIRPLTDDAATQQLLEPFLLLAVNWSMDKPELSRDEAMSRPELARYVTGWGQAGDLALGAYEGNGADRLIGAAWLRRLPDSPGYGWVADDIPELTIAVHPDRQGEGIGTALLRALKGTARVAGERAISLSVEDGNGAAHLYAAAGFRTVGADGDASIMLLDLRA